MKIWKFPGTHIEPLPVFRSFNIPWSHASLLTRGPQQQVPLALDAPGLARSENQPSEVGQPGGELSQDSTSLSRQPPWDNFCFVSFHWLTGAGWWVVLSVYWKRKMEHYNLHNLHISFETLRLISQGQDWQVVSRWRPVCPPTDLSRATTISTSRPTRRPTTSPGWAPSLSPPARRPPSAQSFTFRWELRNISALTKITTATFQDANLSSDDFHEALLLNKLQKTPKKRKKSKKSRSNSKDLNLHWDERKKDVYTLLMENFGTRCFV